MISRKSPHVSGLAQWPKHPTAQQIRDAPEDTTQFGQLAELFERFETSSVEPLQARSRCRSLYMPNDHMCC